MAWKKRKLGIGESKSFKKILQKYICPTVPSKHPVIIIILLLSFAYLGATSEREIPNSPKSKHKRVTSIVHIVKSAVNIPRYNIKQVWKIEYCLSSSKKEVKYQDQDINILDLTLKLSYPSNNQFCHIFCDKTITEWLGTYKNLDEYKNIVRYFHTRLVLFVRNLYYDEYETVFFSTMLSFYHSMDKNKKIALSNLFENRYN